MAHCYDVLLTPLQLLTFYNSVANDGKMVKPLFVSEIQRNGHPVKSIEPMVVNDHIASAETIEKAQELLKAVVEEGTAKRLFSTVYKIAGKTRSEERRVGKECDSQCRSRCSRLH